MEILNQTSPRPLVTKKTIGAFFLIFSLLGFLDATYLTVQHYQGVIPPCTVVNGCEKVLTSSYSTIANVPVALGGAVYYLAMIVLSLLYFDTKNHHWLKRAAHFSIIGLLASAYFISLQLFVIHALCLYCLGSAITSTVLFILGRMELRKMRLASS